MGARSLRRRVLLSSTMLVGALTAYAGRAYAACVASPSPNFICTGVNLTGLAVSANNANVKTSAGFSVNTNAGNALVITGNGALSFTDNFNSDLKTSADHYTALYVRSNGNAGATSGSVSIKTTGDVTGTSIGIFARNEGDGDLAITANGDVVATYATGIYAWSGGNDLGITTGADTEISGNKNAGIFARNHGVGALSITANGDVVSTDASAIEARNYEAGTNFVVETGVGTTVKGNFTGIEASNYGSGALAVTANGDVTGTGSYSRGISARNGGFNEPAGTDLTVTTGVGTTVIGNLNGIQASNYGSGSLGVTANGDVTGTGLFSAALWAWNHDGIDLTVTTGPGTTVTGGLFGILAKNEGDGALAVTAHGDVIGTRPIYATGIYARNYGTDLTITTDTGTAVKSVGIWAINARNEGTGDLTVDANSDVTGSGTNTVGLFAENHGSALSITTKGDVAATSTGIWATNGTFSEHAGTDLSITTGAGTTVKGSSGIQANNYGTGALTIIANGDVTGLSNSGAYARNSGTNLKVSTGVGTTITGSSGGIQASNYGTGLLAVTANGDVFGTSSYSRGISARNGGFNAVAGTDLTVTTGAGTTIAGGSGGIQARNYGSGALAVIADGDVAGTGSYSSGISARNGGFTTPAGTDLTIITGAGTNITGGSSGIQAGSYGTGALAVTTNGDVLGGDYGINISNRGSGALSVTANGDVAGTGREGISAENFGSNLTVTTGVGTSVAGGIFGIFARSYGSGALVVTANGDVANTTDPIGTGIYANARSINGTNLHVTTGPGTNVTGGSGIRATNYGKGTLAVSVKGDVTGTTNQGIYAQNSGTDLRVTTDAGTTVTGPSGIRATNNGSGALTVVAAGDVGGTDSNGSGIEAGNFGTNTTVTTGAGTTVIGGYFGIAARGQGSGGVSVNINGDVTGKIAGVYASTAYASTGGRAIAITVSVEASVTSNGVLADDFAIATYGGPSNVTVAGTLNGGAGGAIRFDQTGALNDRLVLEAGAIIRGAVLGGPGTDSLVLEGSGNCALDVSQIRDFESFSKEGQSHWSLTGTNTEIAAFAVNGGILSVNGSLPNVEFTVNGGTLGGSGIIGGFTVGNGGIVAPGNSIGVMSVNGDFKLNGGAIYEVEVNDAGQSDRTIVKGNIDLTGSVLRVLEANGKYKPLTDYLIIDNESGDAVKGEFAKITNNLAFLTPLVVYDGSDGNDVVLRLIRNDFSFSSFVETDNQRNVANALGQFPIDNPLLLAVLNQTAERARQAFEALSGEVHATVSGVLTDESRYVREAMLGRMIQASYSIAGQIDSLGMAGPQVSSRDSRAMSLGSDDAMTLGSSVPAYRTPPAYGPGLAFWTNAFGAWGNFDGNKNTASADRNLGGFVSGMDANIGGSWRLGLATGFSQSDISVDERHSVADVDSFHLAGYAGGNLGPVALRTGGAWAWNDIDTSRAVVFPGFFEREKASYNADTGQLFGEVAYATRMGSMALEPFAGLAYVEVDTSSFREHGGNLSALHGADSDQNVGYTTLGLRFGTVWHWNEMVLVPHVSAAWQHAFDDVTPEAALAFASTGIGFGVTGAPLAQNSALIDAGLSLNLSPTASIGVSYSGQLASDLTDNAVKGRFTWIF